MYDSFRSQNYYRAFLMTNAKDGPKQLTSLVNDYLTALWCVEQFDWVASYNSITISTLWSSVKSAPLLQESPVIVQTRTLLHSAQQDTISEEAGLLLISWSTVHCSVFIYSKKIIRKFRKANLDQIKKNLHSNWLPENKWSKLGGWAGHRLQLKPNYFKKQSSSSSFLLT